MSFLTDVGALLVLLVCLSNSSAMGFIPEVGDGNASSFKCIERERQALLTFKQGLQDYCDLLPSWGTEENQRECCKWEGVRCSSKTGHVVMIDLRNTDFSIRCFHGTINSSLADLHHLSHLDLSVHHFDGNFPKFICSLTHLKYLNLSYSFYNNEIGIPFELGNLFRLQYLDLGGNWFGGEYQTHFQNFSRLVHLDLSANALRGEISHFFANMSSLEYLDLSQNMFIGTIPHSFRNLFHIKYLDLSDNTGNYRFQSLRSDLEWVSHLTSLKTLRLRAVDLSTANNWQQQLSNLSHLQELDLRRSNLVSPILPGQFNYSASLAILQLSENNLNGSIAISCSLSVLDLQQNNLGGPLADFVSTSTKCANKSLQHLFLSGNQFTGSVPHLYRFSSLQTLDLGDNRLNGTVTESIGQLLNLEKLSLGHNFLQGVISETHFSKLSKLKYLDLSSNTLVFNIDDEWVPPFQLEHIMLASCNLGSSFPKWIQTQKNYSSLNISSTGISDTLPNWFWDLSVSIEKLDLSNNKIYGKILNLYIEFSEFSEMNLSSNILQGPIPSFLSMMGKLDLSNNKFSKVDSFLCANITKNVRYLDLSNNQLSGKLPECWAHFESLTYLDLTNNALLGKMPKSMGSLRNIVAINVQKNNFTGEIPFPLKNCKELIIFDASQNNFSGPIPTWIGELPKLVILILRFNLFSGSLPSNICQLAKVQLLDLSFNNISGSIPKCLNNLTAMANQADSTPTISYSVYDSLGIGIGIERMKYYSTSILWKRKESRFKNTLGLVKIIDLSSNKISGEIPKEIMDLIGLIALNFSRNMISGEIPATIGKLKSLDVLDLSWNCLCGRIPSQISQLGLLGVLNLSYNNLSGEIPIATVFQKFEASAYMGNLELCGIPLQRCLINQIDDTQKSKNHEEDEPLFMQGFYISMAIGFGVGFWGVCCSLFLNKSWRYAYFNFLNDVYKKLYVIVAIIEAKFQSWTRGST
ncbi:hypothetical protein L6164_013428 [Bauhinia variegata]|uniref:Uncharacterized protein n=1 Tax=Bauhinia variegata TaxID=167791 RepID=A0ACB9NJ29_BAUVA|nr:hypothetical protein L6164_013428 [Bauhinia variegata]